MKVTFGSLCPLCRMDVGRRVPRRWWMRFLPLSTALCCDRCSAEYLVLIGGSRVEAATAADSTATEPPSETPAQTPIRFKKKKRRTLHVGPRASLATVQERASAAPDAESESDVQDAGESATAEPVDAAEPDTAPLPSAGESDGLDELTRRLEERIAELQRQAEAASRTVRAASEDPPASDDPGVGAPRDEDDAAPQRVPPPAGGRADG